MSVLPKPSRQQLMPGQVLPYADALAYDRRYGLHEDDVGFYVRRAQRVDGPVLEYGCGTGRITLPIARAGLRVTGVDLSSSMLTRLRARLAEEPSQVARRVTLFQGDMRSLRLKRRHALVIAPFNTFMHLYTRADVEAFLKQARAHLRPHGELCFDVYMPSPAELDGMEGSDYDPLRQVLHTLLDEDGTLLSQRQFFPMELRLLLDKNGFEQVRLTSDFGAKPISDETVSIVVSAKRRSGRS